MEVAVTGATLPYEATPYDLIDCTIDDVVIRFASVDATCTCNTEMFEVNVLTLVTICDSSICIEATFEVNVLVVPCNIVIFPPKLLVIELIPDWSMEILPELADDTVAAALAIFAALEAIPDCICCEANG